MIKLQDLELVLNISFPMLYKDLYSNGMLDWGESGANWYEETLPKLKKKPPLLLFAEDIEIWDPIDFRAAILEVNDKEVYGIGSDFKLIPFAKNGAGDLFVFQFDLQQGDDVPVTFMPHDDCEAVVLAKNLQDFIFRLLLEAVREIDEDSMVFEEEEEDLKGNLIAQLHTHRPFLTAGQIGVLSDIRFQSKEEQDYMREFNVELEDMLSFEETNLMEKPYDKDGNIFEYIGSFTGYLFQCYGADSAYLFYNRELKKAVMCFEYT